jgi:hypothetical protein
LIFEGVKSLLDSSLHKKFFSARDVPLTLTAKSDQDERRRVKQRLDPLLFFQGGGIDGSAAEFSVDPVYRLVEVLVFFALSGFSEEILLSAAA